MGEVCAYGLTENSSSDEQLCLFLENCLESHGYIKILAEAFRPQYTGIRSVLSFLAEAISRPPLLHEYHLTPFSLGAAVSNGMKEEEALNFFVRTAYGLRETENGATPLYRSLKHFLHFCMGRYNLAKVVVEGEETFLICKEDAIAKYFLNDKVIESLLSPSTSNLSVQRKSFSWSREEEPKEYPYLLAKKRTVAKAICERCVQMGYPLWQQYDYENDNLLRSTNISLLSQTKPRSYQVAAVEAATKEGVFNSGCIVLPCGAGKTLVGIMLLCKVKKPTLIVCAGAVSVDQWKNQILEYATLDAPVEEENASLPGKRMRSHVGSSASIRGSRRISVVTGKQKDEITNNTDIVLTTYSMLVSAYKTESRKMYRPEATRLDNIARDSVTSSEMNDNNSAELRFQRKRRSNPKEKLFSLYGLVILDEVHVIPADAFRESLSFVDTKAVVGLTATYVREDRKILDIFHLVGPKLFEISMNTLVHQGYLARVQCVEIHTLMTKEFGVEYMERSSQEGGVASGGTSLLVMLAATNPNKMLCVWDLVSRHLQVGAKILLFCDHIMLLHEYGKMLNAPVVCGSTPLKDRIMVFSDFQATNKVNIICISRVGDVSVNLPSANVVIQVSSHGGSRRQEAQRLGRILRPKDKRSGQHDNAIEAWFYSIVSIDTVEMMYASHRTAFLVDLGYNTRLLELLPTASTPSSVSASEGALPSSLLGGTAKHLERTAQAMKKDRVGDKDTIKKEELLINTIESTSRWLELQHEPDPHTHSFLTLEYQVQLLAKTVSKWEMEYQQNAGASSFRSRNSFEEEEEVEFSSEDQEDGREERDTLQHGDAGLVAFKKELATDRDTYVDISTYALEDVMGVDDTFVYHEL